VPGAQAAEVVARGEAELGITQASEIVPAAQLRDHDVEHRKCFRLNSCDVTALNGIRCARREALIDLLSR
jgi:hypothetical protein